MPAARRFPPPWRIERLPGGWKVLDANGVAVAYCYGDDGHKGVGDQSLSIDEARRIAAQIARLPDLLRPG